MSPLPVPAIPVTATLPGVSDEDLLRQHLAGDDGAFRELLHRHQGWVYAYLAARTRDAAAASDLFQDVFLRVARGAPRFAFRSRFSTWLFAITANVARKHLVKKRVRQWLGRSGAGEDEPTLDDLPSEAPGVEEQVASRERLERVRAALSRLSEKERRVLLLVKVEGKSLEEAASLLALNLNTVKTLVRRGRLKLVEVLGEGDAP